MTEFSWADLCDSADEDDEDYDPFNDPSSGCMLGDDSDSSDDGASSVAASSYYQGEDHDDDELESGRPPRILVESDDWMINPRNEFRMIWDLCILFPLLMYLTIVMPFRMTFANEAPTYSPM